MTKAVIGYPPLHHRASPNRLSPVRALDLAALRTNHRLPRIAQLHRKVQARALPDLQDDVLLGRGSKSRGFRGDLVASWRERRERICARAVGFGNLPESGIAVGCPYGRRDNDSRGGIVNYALQACVLEPRWARYREKDSQDMTS